MRIAELSPRPVGFRPPGACPARGQAGTAQQVVGLTHRQAEDLLDWLQNHGCVKAEVEPDEAGGFTVRFTFPPRAPEETRDEGGNSFAHLAVVRKVGPGGKLCAGGGRNPSGLSAE